MICKQFASISRLAVVLSLATAAACSVSVDGKVACVDSSSCPDEAPYCVGAVPGTPGRCFATDPNGDGGNPAGSVAITGIVGHQATDIVSGTVRIEVLATSNSGVAKVQLTAGGTVFDVAASSPPLYYFDVVTVGTADETLTAQLFPGDGSAPITSAPFTLHVNSLVPVLTVGAPTPASAHGGSLVSLTVMSSVPLNALGGTVALHSDPTTVIGQLSITTGQLGVATSYVLEFVVPVNAASGAYDITVTGADSAGVSAVPVVESLNVVGPFTITSLTVATLGNVLETLGGRTLPAAAPSTAITVVATVPATVPLTGGSVVFTLTDAEGNTRTLMGTQTQAGGGSAPQTITVSETLMPTDASGIATISATITDQAGNIGVSTQSFIIDGLAPFVTGLTPNFSSADTLTGCSNGACVGNAGATVTFTGQASEPVSSATFTSSGKGTATGSCQCNGAACAPGGSTSPVITCTVPVPTITTNGADIITVSLTDAVGNMSSSSLASNSAQFLAVAPPTITSFTANLTSVPGGTPVVLTTNFPAGNSGFISNSTNGFTVPVAPGTVMTSLTPTTQTAYTLNVSNAVGTTIASSPLTINVVASGFGGSLTFAEPIITGGRAPSAGVVINIPSFTGAQSALLLDSNGNTATLSNGNPVTSAALIALGVTGGPLTIAAPSTTSSTNSQFSYTLIVLTPSNPPTTFSTSAVLSVVPVPTAQLSANITAVTTGNQVQLTVKTTGAACTVAGNCEIVDDHDATIIPVTGDTNASGGITVTATVDQSKTYTAKVKNTATLAVFVSSNGVAVTAVPSPTGTLTAAFNPVTINNMGMLTLQTMSAACTVSGNCFITNSANPSVPIPVVGNTNASGGVTVSTPAITASTTFTASIKNSAQDAVAVTLPAVTLTTRPAPTVTLSAAKTTVAVGNQINFTLTLTGADCGTATECELTNDQDASIINFTGSTVNVTADKNRTYTAQVKASVNDNIFVSSNGVLITVVSSLAVSGYTNPATAGTGSNVTVTAKDTNGNTATGYTGTVAFTSSDTKGSTTLPGNFTFTAGNNGTASISGTDLTTATTNASITATDTTSPTTKGSQTGITVNAAAPNKLVFTAEPPASASAATSLGTVSVAVEDMYSNVNPTNTASITITLGTNPTGANLTGGGAVTTNNGVATFTNLKVDKAGTGYVLTATSTGPSLSVNSTPFAVTVGTASQLVFTAEPQSMVGSGTDLVMTVSVEDVGGNLVTTGTPTIALTTSAGTLAGATSVQAALGIAVFNTTMNQVTLSGTPASGVMITAASNGLTSAVSSGVQIVAGPSTQIAFATQPSNLTSNTAATVTVQFKDNAGTATGNTPTGAKVSLALTSGPGTLSGGAATAPNASGLVTFSISIDKAAASGDVLTATATPSGGTATSSSFSVAAGMAAKLAFTVQPAATVGSGTNPQPSGSPAGVQVTIEDSAGNNAGGTATVALSTSAGTLSGTTSVAAVAGVATFSAAILSGAPASNVTLGATSGTLTAATSSSFSIIAGPATQIAFATQPSSLTSNTAATVTVQFKDNFGTATANTPTGAKVSLALTTGTGTLTGGAQTSPDGTGLVTFSISIDKAGTGDVLTATATPSGGTATSNSFSVAAGAPTQLGFTTQPAANCTTTSNCGPVTVQIEDAAQNPTTIAGGISVALTLSGTGGGTLMPAIPPANTDGTSGAVSFATVDISASGTYMLTATGTLVPSGTITGTSNPIHVITGSRSPHHTDFAGGLAFAPNVILNNQTAKLAVSLPQLASGSASSVTLSVSGDPKSPAARRATVNGSPLYLGSSDLGSTMEVDAPQMAALRTSTVVTYALTASDGADSATTPGEPLRSFPGQVDLAAARVGSTATFIPGSATKSGQDMVLIAGGASSFDEDGQCSGTIQASAEIYEPATGVARPLGGSRSTMSAARCKHTAVFTNGKVYLFGGSADGSKAVEVFDPMTESFSGAASLQLGGRIGATATLVDKSILGASNDKVVIAGGSSASGLPSNSIELFDPATGRSTLYGGPRSHFEVARAEHTATLLGSFLYFIGGETADGSIEVLDLRKPVLAGGQLSSIAAPENAFARYGHSAIAISPTEILVAGGLDARHAYTPAVAGGMQVYTVESGKLVSVSASAPLAQMRARAALVEAGPIGQYLLVQGSEASSRYSREDRSVSSVEAITVASGAPSSRLLSTSLTSGRISPAVTNLQVPGASNFVFFIPGAASPSAGAELLIGP